MLEQLTQINNSTKEATTNYFANANNLLVLSSLFTWYYRHTLISRAVMDYCKNPSFRRAL